MTKAAVSSIGVIGDGAWGTTLAKLLAEKGCAVSVWGPFPENLNKMAATRENARFLPGIVLPAGITYTDKLENLVAGHNCLIIAIPSQYLDPVLKRIAKLPLKNKAFVSVVKGIDVRNFKTMSQLVEARLGKVPLAVLSGPTIALEVARKVPTTAVSASRNARWMSEVQALFSTDYFRVYTNPDVLGVEICGSVKNIIALACGVCDGLGFGTNTKAALLTRGLVEMKRLGVAFKAKPETFNGLTGLGDLATTCFSPQSRNRHVGEEIGKGRPVDDILAGMASVAEGVVTAKAVCRLSRKLKIDMPITQAVYDMVYTRRPPQKVVADLMRRSLKKE
jgi:glycerol-3-phosphate dehydrogenase (NAD(P)+)